MMETPEKEVELKKELDEALERAKEIRKQLPKKAKRQTLPQSLTDEEFSKIISHLKDNQSNKEAKISFLLAYESGLRISEVKNLKKEDIDIGAKKIFIRQGKYSKDRVVPLPKTWKSYMMNLIPIKKSIRSLERNFKTAAKKAGLRKDFHYHSLRHSFCSHCLERGMPINQLQLLVGHSNVQTTNIYIKANPQDALASYNEKF